MLARRFSILPEPIRRGLFIGFVCALTQTLAHASSSTCPDLTLGEKAEDCPWSEVARNLISEADAGRPVLPTLKSSVPELFKQIERDAKNPSLRSLWGKSINFDEFAKGIIVHPEIIKSIGSIFGSEVTDQRVVHAGMEHVYGYLFSVLKTPYGYKRARWVQPTLEQGFQLTSKILSPTPPEGTLFGNLTYFIGKIAFRNDPIELNILKKLKKDSPQVAKELITFPYNKLKVTRLIETLSVPTSSEKTRTITLRTDLVRFQTDPQDQSNSHLLIYSIVDPELGGAKLVTAFPVDTAFVEKTLNPENLGKEKTVLARFNAFVEGLSGKELKGERQVIPSETSTQ